MPGNNSNASAELSAQYEDEPTAVVEGWGPKEVVTPMIWQTAPVAQSDQIARPDDNAVAAMDTKTTTAAEVIDLATGVALSGHRDALVLQEIERLYGPAMQDVLTGILDAPTDASCDEDRLIARFGDS